MSDLSLNARAGALADALLDEADALRLRVSRTALGATLVDCGSPGGLEAGLRLARICMAGLGEAVLQPSGLPDLNWSVLVRTSQPALACLASQYAGWHFAGPDGGALLGSGPARALARREPLFDDLHHLEVASRAVLVLEGDVPPDDTLACDVAQACALPCHALTVLHASTGSLAGTVQIAARVLECAVQKARHLGFPIADLTEAVGQAPVAPPHPDASAAMGRSNDAIIYGGRVHLFVQGSAAAARELAAVLPSHTAPGWGRSFAEIHDEAEGDFSRIDPGLFSPAEVAVTALNTGETYRSGRVDTTRLHAFVEAD